ncbi:MAG TPA: hypothetical protein P5087_00105 [Eubacteriales bacterium]|nr:hypothetical protein [Eubacteriales bacterium]
MKFYHKNPLYLNILISALAIAQVIMIFINICKLAGWFNMYSLMQTLEIFQIVLSVCILAICGLMLFMRYKFKENKIQIKFGPFDLTGGKFEIDKVRAAIKRAADNGLYLSVYTGDVEPVIMKINISPKRYDEFIDDIKKINKSISVVDD